MRFNFFSFLLFISRRVETCWCFVYFCFIYTRRTLGRVWDLLKKWKFWRRHTHVNINAQSLYRLYHTYTRKQKPIRIEFRKNTQHSRPPSRQLHEKTDMVKLKENAPWIVFPVESDDGFFLNEPGGNKIVTTVSLDQCTPFLYSRISNANLGILHV